MITTSARSSIVEPAKAVPNALAIRHDSVQSRKAANHESSAPQGTQATRQSRHLLYVVSAHKIACLQMENLSTGIDAGQKTAFMQPMAQRVSGDRESLSA
jgi:hypothetical protein